MLRTAPKNKSVSYYLNHLLLSDMLNCTCPVYETEVEKCVDLFLILAGFLQRGGHLSVFPARSPLHFLGLNGLFAFIPVPVQEEMDTGQ